MQLMAIHQQQAANKTEQKCNQVADYGYIKGFGLVYIF
jgi:hypothetical protein